MKKLKTEESRQKVYKPAEDIKLLRMKPIVRLNRVAKKNPFYSKNSIKKFIQKFSRIKANYIIKKKICNICDKNFKDIITGF